MEVRPVYFSTVELNQNYLTAQDLYYAFERITLSFDESWSRKTFKAIADSEGRDIRTFKVQWDDIGAPKVEGSNLYFLQIC